VSEQARKVKLAKLLPVDQAAPFTPVVQAGMRALSVGQADQHQQVEVFNWLLQEAAGIGTQSFRAGDPQQTAFGEGRRFVAIQMMMLLQQREG
jgi:hypothetical protein